MRSNVWLAAMMLALSLAGPSRASDRAFDRLDRDLGPYLDHKDPLSFAMKVNSVAADEYTFWRGTKGLFYSWCKTHCADWLADKSNYVASHGDLHFGNIGVYPTVWNRDGSATLAFGEIDFDDADTLPFQIELLQGLVTLRLLIAQNSVELPPAQQDEILASMIDAYVAAQKSANTATELLRDRPTVRDMLGGQVTDYDDDLVKYVKNGHFKSKMKKDSGNILRPVEPARWDGFAAALAEAAGHDTRLSGMLKDPSAAGLRKAIKDVALRVRTGSSGSQGLNKYLVLLDNPFKNNSGDAILYLKQEIPTAAQRSGAIPPDAQPAGQRYVEVMNKLTDPPILLSSWATLEGGSYWVSLKEPWSAEMPYGAIDHIGALRNAALIWGTVAGFAHRHAGGMFADRLTPALRTLISARAADYAKANNADYADFVSDPRVKQCQAAVEAMYDHAKP